MRLPVPRTIAANHNLLPNLTNVCAVTSVKLQTADLGTSLPVSFLNCLQTIAVCARSLTLKKESTTYNTSLGRRASNSTPSAGGANISDAEPLLLDLVLVRDPLGVEAGLEEALLRPFHRGNLSDENEPR